MILVLFKTRLGKVVQATVSNASMVSALGINTPLVFKLVFGFGTWLAGVAGVAAAPLLSVFPGMADQIGMDAFVVVVVGGLGSLGGALLSSLVIGEGVLEQCGSDGGSLAGGMASYGRFSKDGRGRLLISCRQEEGHDHPRGRKHLSC